MKSRCSPRRATFSQLDFTDEAQVRLGIQHARPPLAVEQQDDDSEQLQRGGQPKPEHDELQHLDQAERTTEGTAGELSKSK